MLADIQANGFFLCRGLVDTRTIERLIEGFEKAKDSVHARAQDGDTYALRNILRAVPEVQATAIDEQLMTPVRSVLGQEARPVKAILFDKTAAVNWNLRMHQDNVISVQEKIEVPGFTGWSVKVGIPHVWPPAEILEQMLAARIHIDDCPLENGALNVIPGSHAEGRLSSQQVTEWKKTGTKVVCAASRGDVLFMRPLLLHSSAKSTKPSHRRVLHIEYAGCDLPGGLRWGV